MSQIYQLLDQLEPVEQDQQQMRPLTALFYWPLSGAFIVALLYLLYLSIAQRLNHNITKTSSFKEQIND